MTDDILSRTMRHREEYMRNVNFKNIFIWNQEIKRGLSGRSGHTTVSYKDKLVFIGGIDQFETNSFNGDLLVYDTSTSLLLFIPFSSQVSLEDYPEYREVFDSKICSHKCNNRFSPVHLWRSFKAY